MRSALLQEAPARLWVTSVPGLSLQSLMVSKQGGFVLPRSKERGLCLQRLLQPSQAELGLAVQLTPAPSQPVGMLRVSGVSLRHLPRSALGVKEPANHIMSESSERRGRELQADPLCL